MRPRHEQTISEQAAEWFLTLEAGASAEDRAKYAKWLLESPRHVEEALAVEALYHAYEGVDAEKSIPLGPTPVETGVLPLHGAAPAAVEQKQPRRWMRYAGLGIAAGVLLGWTLFVGDVLPGGKRYTTEIGEQRTVELPDGSVANLNTRSRMRVDFSGETREIHLLEGEALFRVAPDAARPFRVLVDRTVIQAVGTQFNVYRQSAGVTTVSVLEGAVKVSGHSPKLAAGEVVRIEANGRVDEVKGVDAAEVVTAWRQRRLKFHSDTLADVTAEFNRYNNTGRLEVRDAEIGQRRLTGQFDADDPNSLLAFLAEDRTLRFDRNGDTTVIRRAEK